MYLHFNYLRFLAFTHFLVSERLLMISQIENSFKCNSFVELSDKQQQFFEIKKKEVIRAGFEAIGQNYIRINGNFVTNKDVYSMLATCLFHQQISYLLEQDQKNGQETFRNLHQKIFPQSRSQSKNLGAVIKQTISQYNSYEKVFVDYFKGYNQQQVKQKLLLAIKNTKKQQIQVQVHELTVDKQKVERKKLVKNQDNVNNIILIVKLDNQIILGFYFLSQKNFNESVVQKREDQYSIIKSNIEIEYAQVSYFQVPIKRIERYPFPIEEQPNHLHIAYIAFAGTGLMRRLGIMISGYRRIIIQNQRALVFICHGPSYDQEQYLFVSYDIYNFVRQHRNKLQAIDCIQNKRQTYYVSLLNRNQFGLRTIDGYLMPQLSVLDQLHILTSQQLQTDFINSLVTKYPFVVQKFGSGGYHINLAHIDQGRFSGNWKMRTLLKRKSEQNKRSKITNFLRIRLCVQLENKKNEDELYLFQPGYTKLVILKPLGRIPSFCNEFKMPELYKRVLEQQPYNLLFKQLYHKICSSPSFMVALYLQRGTGVFSILRQISQVSCLNMITYDCMDFASPKQVYQRLKTPYSQDTLVYIKNTQWLKMIAAASSTNSGTHSGFEPYKNVLRTIQKLFYQSSKKTLHRSVLIIQSEEPVDSQLFESAETIQFILSKQQKIKFLSWVLQGLQFFKQDIQKDNVVFKTALGIGWTRFFKITQYFVRKFNSQKQKVFFSQQNMIQNANTNQFLTQLVQEIHKHTKVEKVQNIANITWDDIGGLETAKEQIIETIMLPTKHPQIFDEKIPPRTGLLFYGPPGTGKTMLGKCIANECKMGFISVKGPELLNMYIGQSEKNLRRLFERAYKSRPCIVFMDELDALIPKKGNSGDSNQVMDRIVSELLMQMDIAGSNGIFIIGATNRPDLLDPSILVAGRFDKQVYLGISKNKADQLKILQAQTRKLNLDEQIDLARVLDILPDNLTGADFYGLTSKAIMNAMERVVAQYDRRMLQNERQTIPIGDINVIIRQQDFIQAARTLVPSVSEAQLRHYETLKQKYS